MLHKLPSGAIRRTSVAAAMVSAVAAASLTLAPAAQATPGCTPDVNFVTSVPAPVGPPSLFAWNLGGSTGVNMSVLGADTKAYDFDVFTLENSVTGLECVDGVGIDQPAVVVNDQKLQYFVTGGDHAIWFKDWDFFSQTWSGWKTISGSSSAGGVDAVVSGNRTDIFYLSNSTHSVVHQWQTVTGGGWTTESLGGTSAEPPSVTRGGDGRMHAWVTGTNGAIYFNAGNSGAWTGWRKLPSGASFHGPAATVGYGSTNAREDVFVTGTNGAVYQATLTNLTAFTGFRKIASPVDGIGATRISAAAERPGHMLVVSNLADGRTVEWEYHGSGWQGPFEMVYTCDTCLPGGSSAPSAGSAAAGRLGSPKGMDR